MTHPNELPDTLEPFDKGYEWYCPYCRSLIADEAVKHKSEDTNTCACGTSVKLLSPDEIIALRQ